MSYKSFFLFTFFGCLVFVYAQDSTRGNSVYGMGVIGIGTFVPPHIDVWVEPGKTISVKGIIIKTFKNPDGSISIGVIANPQKSDTTTYKYYHAGGNYYDYYLTKKE
jgi:hypothetical protein